MNSIVIAPDIEM